MHFWFLLSVFWLSLHVRQSLFLHGGISGFEGIAFRHDASSEDPRRCISADTKVSVVFLLTVKNQTMISHHGRTLSALGELAQLCQDELVAELLPDILKAASLWEEVRAMRRPKAFCPLLWCS